MYVARIFHILMIDHRFCVTTRLMMFDDLLEDTQIARSRCEHQYEVDDVMEAVVCIATGTGTREPDDADRTRPGLREYRSCDNL
jgi:hypothetical protein